MTGIGDGMRRPWVFDELDQPLDDLVAILEEQAGRRTGEHLEPSVRKRAGKLS